MIVDPSTLLSAASVIVALTCGTATGAEFVTKEEAIAMVKRAVALIKAAAPFLGRLIRHRLPARRPWVPYPLSQLSEVSQQVRKCFCQRHQALEKDLNWLP